MADKNVVYFGKVDYRNAEKVFGIKRKDRRQHMYIVGKTGTGKSALIHNFISQDIANGDGVCVVDPHGELVEGVLENIPKERAKDVVYFNPSDVDYPIGFNVLEMPDPKYKHLVASGLMAIFTKIWSNVWSARMEYILNNAVLALLDTPETTLLGIPRILVDKDYRQKIIANLKDPVVKAFWVNEYEKWQEKFRNEAIAPIQNKVGQFLSTPLIRNVVGQPKSAINIFDIMNNQKILLINVSKGRIGEDNAALLGAMLITKIQLAAMERVRIPEDERKDFYLYVDEFQNFATDSFASVLSEARKYRLNLIIVHQYIGQLVQEFNTKVRDAIFGNTGTMIVFRVGAADAEFLEKEFEPEFLIHDIVNLPNYHVYLKLMIDGLTSRPFSAKTLPPVKNPEGVAVMQDIIDTSRKQYTSSREEVEEDIRDWSGTFAGPGRNSYDEGKGDKSQLFSATCSSCGKETKVPFQPAPDRPVYCSDCLAKIKSGEMQPARGMKKPQQSDKAGASAMSLSGLGIEFESSKEAKPIPLPPPEVTPRPAGQAPVARPPRFTETKPNPPARTLSLNELKPREGPPPMKPKTTPNVSAIRDALKEIFKKGSSEDKK